MYVHVRLFSSFHTKKYDFSHIYDFLASTKVLIIKYWCPLKIFGDFRDFYFLGQPIYWTYKQPLCCYKMTE